MTGNSNASPFTLSISLSFRHDRLELEPLQMIIISFITQIVERGANTFALHANASTSAAISAEWLSTRIESRNYRDKKLFASTEQNSFLFFPISSSAKNM